MARRFGAWDDTWRLPRRVTFVIDGAGVVRYVETGSPALETTGVLRAVTALARSR